MKLAKVEHYRCDQPAGKWGLTTYVWVPDEMSEHEFGLLCEAAKDKYLANEQTWKDASPASAPGYSSAVWENYPDTMTVSEIKAAQAAKQDAYKAYENKRKDARKSFAELLVEVSNGAIQSFWKTPGLSVKHGLDWGHHHGTTIDHGATKLYDYPWTAAALDEDENDGDEL